MKRESIYYTVSGAGIFVILAIALWQVWPEPEEPLDPPQVVAQRLQTSQSKEEQVRAARDFVRHGKAARQYIREELARHESYQPEVVAPLVQAAMKSEDYHSLPVLIGLMRSEDVNVRGRAGAAVQKIMGANYGFRANLPEDKREQIIAQIESEYKLFHDRFPEVYGH